VVTGGSTWCRFGDLVSGPCMAPRRMFLEKNEEAFYLGVSANSCYVQLSPVSQLYFHLPNQSAGHVRAEIRRSSDLISGVVSD
jgi:hypothetical protein